MVEGLASTARVITAAAAIMVCVFGSFVFGDMRAIKLIGLGLAVAVLIDATIVRMVLVPATMELLGGRNWWLPGWLDRRPPARVDGPPASRGRCPSRRPAPPDRWAARPSERTMTDTTTLAAAAPAAASGGRGRAAPLPVRA